MNGPLLVYEYDINNIVTDPQYELWRGRISWRLSGKKQAQMLRLIIYDTSIIK